MKLAYETQSASGGWTKVGTIEAEGEAAPTLTNLGGYAVARDPMFNPDLRRIVRPDEGELYLMTLADYGGSTHARFRVLEVGA